MEIIVPPPSGVLYIAIALPIFVSAVVLIAARNRPLMGRLAAIGIALVVSAGVLSFGFKSVRFGWDESGIHDGSFGARRDIAWSEIQEVERVHDFLNTEYRLMLRTNGSAYGNFRAGYFRIASGSTLRVFILTENRDALVVRTHDETYLFAPSPFEPFVAAVRAHTGKPVW